MPRYQVDESGELLRGVFYRIEGKFARAPKSPGQDDHWVVSSSPDEASFVYATATDYRWTEEYECPRDFNHVTNKRIAAVSLDLHGGGLGPIIPNLDFLLINRELNDRLTKSGLGGTETILATINSDQSGARDPEIYAVRFSGRDPIRKRVFVPEDSNKCPLCGVGPVFCPDCGCEVFYQCPKCGNACVAYGDKPLEEHTRILFMPDPPLGDVIDGALWDGTDFLSGRGADVITRRALDFLLSIHAAPFRAEPLRTFVGACTKKQLTAILKMQKE